MRHGRKTKKLTLFDQIISRFKLKALYSVKYYNLLLPVSLVIIIIIIIACVAGAKRGGGGGGGREKGRERLL